MTHEPSEPGSEYQWDEATRVLSAEPSHAPPELLAPLDARTRQTIIAQAIARRRTAATAPAKPPSVPRRYLARFVPLTAGLALAASLAVMLRSPDQLGPVTFDLMPGGALERGRSPDERHADLSLHNEPGWSARLPEGTDTEALQFYLVAGTAAGTLSLLDPPIEHRNAAFRVKGEVHESGLHPGDTTLYFLVGPRAAGDDALEVVAAFRAGEAPPSNWALRPLAARITE